VKEFQMKSLQTIEPQVINQDGNEFSVKGVFDPGLLEKCTASFVEVAPGHYAYSYHYHETVEEIFYVISGEGAVRTIKGEIPVKAGDILSFPTGEGGSHVIRNTSPTEQLVYLDFDTRGECEIAHLPDIQKIKVVSRLTYGIFDESRR